MRSAAALPAATSYIFYRRAESISLDDAINKIFVISTLQIIQKCRPASALRTPGCSPACFISYFFSRVTSSKFQDNKTFAFCIFNKTDQFNQFKETNLTNLKRQLAVNRNGHGHKNSKRFFLQRDLSCSFVENLKSILCNVT